MAGCQKLCQYKKIRKECLNQYEIPYSEANRNVQEESQDVYLASSNFEVPAFEMIE